MNEHSNKPDQKFTFPKSLDSQYLGHLSCLNRIVTPAPLKVTVSYTHLTLPTILRV